MHAHINGFPIDVFSEDPDPSPLDITDCVMGPGRTNTIDFKLVKTSEPLILAVREYDLVTVDSMLAPLGSPADVPLFAKGRECQGHLPFDLRAAVAHGIVYGEMVCPICKAPLDLREMDICS
jgi:hypothetical protein